MSRYLPVGAAAAALLAAGLGCGDPIEPTVVASVELSSAVDTILADGRTSQLAATARTAAGDPVPDAVFTWTSANGVVVSVSTGGLATAQGPGSTRITAEVEGTGVSGEITLVVVNADLAAVGSLAGDPYGGALINGLTSAARGPAESARAGCASGAGNGNVVSILDCLADLRAQAAAASGADRVLLTVVGLYADQIERRLGL